MKRELYTFKIKIKSLCDKIVDISNDYGFIRVDGTNRRTGGSLKRNNLSEYEFIDTRTVIKNPKLFDAIEELGDKLNLKDELLVEYLLQFKKGDFLDWMDYDLWKPKTIGKFFTIALTKGNYIEFLNEDETTELIQVPQYGAMEFNTGDLHRVTPVKKTQTWLVLMVCDDLCLEKKFKDIEII